MSWMIYVLKETEKSEKAHLNVWQNETHRFNEECTLTEVYNGDIHIVYEPTNNKKREQVIIHLNPMIWLNEFRWMLT